MDPKPPTTDGEADVYTREEKTYYWRSLVSFWIFGLSSNVGYVAILAAAYDILQATRETNTTLATIASPNTTSDYYLTEDNESDYLICNKISTGTFLLVNIPIDFFIKALFPFFSQRISYPYKVISIAVNMVLCFLLVAFSDNNIYLSILGFAFSLVATGILDISFLGLTTFYHKNTVSAWSSGTGGSGVVGSLGYVGLTYMGLSLRNIMFCMLTIPALMLLTYFFILGKPLTAADDTVLLIDQTKHKNVDPLTLKQKVFLVPSLFKYSGPLCIVYFCQYFINQGLHELLYFNHVVVSKEEQYRWYQVSYQFGVFLSRSSVNIFHIRNLWIFPTLQFITTCVFLSQVLVRFIPSFLIVLFLIIWEGLVSGVSYVNVFFKLTNEVPQDEKEFSIGMVTAADAMGTSASGIVSLFVQKAVCRMHIRIS